MQDVCVITVKVSAKELKVPDTLDVKLNDTDEAAIEAKCEPEDASNISFDFASSDEEVATVDKDGKVKVLKAGECDITTTLLQDGEKVTEKTTHVKAFYEVESITLDSNEGKLTVGNSHTIKATVAPEEVADRDHHRVVVQQREGCYCRFQWEGNCRFLRECNHHGDCW